MSAESKKRHPERVAETGPCTVEIVSGDYLKDLTSNGGRRAVGASACIR